MGSDFSKLLCFLGVPLMIEPVFLEEIVNIVCLVLTFTIDAFELV